MGPEKNDPGYLTSNWCQLNWGEWFTLSKNAASKAPREAGLYRVKRADSNQLDYIGETGRPIKSRLMELARGIEASEMPFRDPHTAAPCLWAINQEYGDIEVSCAVSNLNSPDRKALERYLIWEYRLETGSSPTANFGRVIKGWRMSSYRKDGMRGKRLLIGENEAHSDLGLPPTTPNNIEDVLGQNWVGQNWTDSIHLQKLPIIDNAPSSAGLYRIWKQNADILWYIGESKNLKTRLLNHAQNHRNLGLLCSYTPRPELDSLHKRQEAESDLIGAHFKVCGCAPEAQYGRQTIQR